jgi:WD40 repeat protein
VPNVAQDFKAKANERIRILANWDPIFPDEKVDWYSEFIHRSAPIAINWLQQPRNIESGEPHPMEVRGAGIFNSPGGDEASMVVGPLDDGSICIWDVNGPPGRRGRIIARSATHTLSTTGSAMIAPRSKMINTGVTECISIDNHRKRAYIAVQCGK